MVSDAIVDPAPADAGDDGDGGLGDASSDSPPPVEDVQRGEFDPQNVYLAGTLSEGACYRDAIVDYENPDVAAVGFDCYFADDSAAISPSGTLTYFNTFENRLREFTCDDCPGWTPSAPYPEDVLANDPILPTPPCDGEDTGTLRFALSPDGSRIHGCDGSTGWHHAASGSQVLELESGERVLTYGWSGFVLTADAVIDTTMGERTPVTGLPPTCRILTTRSGRETGFRMALQCGDATELWSVDHAGSAVRVGVYPAPPEEYPPSSEARLAGDGTLVQLARGPEVLEDTIIERTTEGRSELMYTEARSPAVKIHISSLVTGP